MDKLTEEIKLEKKIENFGRRFPTPLHHELLKKSDGLLYVFWSQDDQPANPELQNNNNDSFLASVNTRRMISSMIKDAFMHVNVGRQLSIIQFWAPVMTSSGDVVHLSTSRQPFAVNDLISHLSKYRSRCIDYQYPIDDRFPQHPIVTAFLNRFPQFASLKNLKGAGIPFVDCQLKYSYFLPISFPTQNPSRRCIGVVEFSIEEILPKFGVVGFSIEEILPKFSIEEILPDRRQKFPNETITEMITALRRTGLFVFQIHERIPDEIIHGLKPDREIIEQALDTVCREIDIPFAQVWIAFEHDHHVPFSSDLEVSRKKQLLSLKLAGYLDDTGVVGFQSTYGEYDRFCDMFPLEMGEDFVEKTLEDYKPRFCNDVSKLSGGTLVKKLFDDVGGSRSPLLIRKKSRLAICLRSIYARDICYAFEFIWEANPDPMFVVSILEKLLLVLRELLPSFEHASGAKLDDKLDLITVGDSTATDTMFSKIFQSLLRLPNKMKMPRP